MRLRFLPEIAGLRSHAMAGGSIWSVLQPIFWLAVGLLAGFVYLYGPAFAASGFTATEALPVPLFFSQAVILAVLLLTPRRWWWLYLLAYFGLQVVQGLWYGLSLEYAAVSNVANVIEALLAAWLPSRFIALPPRFARLHEVGIYVGCVVAAAAIGATWGTAIRALEGFPIWSSWTGWFLADVLASLILAPAIVLWVDVGWRGLLPGSRARAIEAIALCATLVVVGVLVFGTRIAAPDTAPALLYVPVPALMWAAVRFGPRGVLTALSFVTVLAIAGAANDLGPFVGRSAEANVYTMQVFLFGVGIPLLCLAALVLERQQAQLGLQSSEQRYRAVVSNFPRGSVLLFGHDMRHLFADGRGLADMGLSPATVEGKTPAEVFPTEIASMLAPNYEAALKGREVSVEISYHGCTYETQVLPVRYGGGKIGMVIMQEITEQRRAELLAELDRTRTVFFSNVSHELRTPLTLLLGPVEEALRDAESPLQRERLEVAERNAQRLLKLTNALLDFARIEAGRVDAAYESVDLASLTADLAGAFRSAIEVAGLRLEVDCPPLPDGVDVYVDRDLWEKVVLNLLSNALKFTFVGEISVSMRATDGAANVELRVRDTGVGIPAEELPRLFERFFRIRDQRSRTQDGSGIGLALVQELVRLHGGTIAASSEVGVGTEFVVTVPTGHAHLATDHLRTTRELESTATGARAFVEEALSWSTNGDAPELAIDPPAQRVEELARILVADDNADVRTYLRRLLGREHAVEAVADGRAALQAIRDKLPDLVIADVMMPGLDGLSLVRAIREDPRTQALPVVLLSARAGEEARVDGLGAGADDYLVKPFAARELMARVAAHLALQKQRRRLLDAERSARAEAEGARHSAERASSRAHSIQSVTAALARAESLQDVGEAVIHEALPVLNAVTGTLLLRSDTHDVFTVVAPTGYALGVESQYLRVPQGAELPAAEAVRTRQPLWIESAAAVASQFPYWTARPTGNKALAALPLIVDDQSVGSLVIGFATERVFDSEDRAFLLTLAGQCAAAVNRVQLHAAAQMARSQAELALRTRDEFLRSLAHDLKTPLTSLAWHAQLLRQSDVSQVASSAAAVEASARELMADIDELRDLVRQQEDEASLLQREPVDLLALMSAVVSTSADGSDHNVRVVTQERSLVVEGDRARLQRALANLLDNAFKYSPRGTDVVVTMARTEADQQHWAEISVQDRGIGIPETDLPLVFDRYHRGANVVGSTIGEGIGLASARQLVEWHGGRLTVVSTEGQGSTFTMWIPVAQPLVGETA